MCELNHVYVISSMCEVIRVRVIFDMCEVWHRTGCHSVSIFRDLKPTKNSKKKKTNQVSQSCTVKNCVERQSGTWEPWSAAQPCHQLVGALSTHVAHPLPKFPFWATGRATFLCFAKTCRVFPPRGQGFSNSQASALKSITSVPI